MNERPVPPAPTAPSARGLGEEVRRQRIALGLSQEALAERASNAGDAVRQSDISRLELGKVGLPRRPRLERLAAVFGMPVGELLARSGWAGAADALAAPAPALVPVLEGGAASTLAPPPTAPPPASPAKSDHPRADADFIQNSRLRDAMARSQAIRDRAREALRRSVEVYDRAARPPGGNPSRASHLPPPGAGDGAGEHGTR